MPFMKSLVSSSTVLAQARDVLSVVQRAEMAAHQSYRIAEVAPNAFLKKAEALSRARAELERMLWLGHSVGIHVYGQYNNVMGLLIEWWIGSMDHFRVTLWTL